MKKSYVQQAREQKKSIKQKLSARGMHLVIKQMTGRFPCQHWMVMRGKKHVMHYWPSSGNTRDMRANRNIGNMSPMSMCHVALGWNKPQDCADGPRIDSCEKDDSVVNQRDGSVSTPHCERLMEVFSEKVTFGKYKGKMWSEVPESYLKWLAENSFMRDAREIAKAILRELRENPPIEDVEPIDTAREPTVRSETHQPEYVDRLREAEIRMCHDYMANFGPETEIHKKYKKILEDLEVEEAPF